MGEVSTFCCVGDELQPANILPWPWYHEGRILSVEFRSDTLFTRGSHLDVFQKSFERNAHSSFIDVCNGMRTDVVESSPRTVSVRVADKQRRRGTRRLAACRIEDHASQCRKIAIAVEGKSSH